ncbi:MAG: DUF4430 domain-containing protein [Candidatus Staskawiczbacteria bacterium]|jgi:hypothetical protein
MEIKKSIYIIIGVVIIIFISGWLIFSSDLWKVNIAEPDVVQNVEEPNIVQDVARKEVILTIDDGEGDPNIINAEFREGMTAFDLLKEGAEKLPLELKTKNYDIGILIEAIGDKENGQGGKYWLYYINGQLPMISADKNKIEEGDKVEFKFGKPSF